MNLNLLLLSFQKKKKQIILWDSFTDIHLWNVMTLIVITQTKYYITSPKNKKSVFLLGDFNVNLLNYNEHNHTNEFLDSPASTHLYL